MMAFQSTVKASVLLFSVGTDMKIGFNTVLGKLGRVPLVHQPAYTGSASQGIP